jgi:hypothetical protein
MTALRGPEAIARMNEISGLMGNHPLPRSQACDDLLTELFQVAIDSNTMQLREELEIEWDIPAVNRLTHELIEGYSLDEYANSNADVFLLINGAMRALIMMTL